MNKTEFMAELRRERAAWDDLVAQVPEQRRTLPGVAGYWSLKDVIAHLTWYEKTLLALLDDPTSAEHPWQALELETRNRLIYEENQDRTFDDVLAESAGVFERIAAHAERLTEAELQQEGYFQSTPTAPWQAVAWDTYEHYHQHDDDVRIWINAKNGGASNG